MNNVTNLSQNLRCIDLRFQGQPGVIASYLLESAGDRALIEIGPSSTLDTLLSSLSRIGVPAESITSLLVTHIHLDHAGAAGSFLERFPGAQLFVHELGAPHLIDPGKLLASATRIYGDRMESLWGDVRAVPSDRIVPLQDGDTITIGSIQLDVLYTPGHASHHVAFFEPESDAVFTGDVAMVRLQDVPYVRPPTPPPDLDLEKWSRSLDRLQELPAQKFYLTHFGEFDNVSDHLDQARRNLADWTAIVTASVQENLDREQIIDRLKEHVNEQIVSSTSDRSAIARSDLAAPYGMSVDGILRYLRKKAEAASESAGSKPG